MQKSQELELRESDLYKQISQRLRRKQSELKDLHEKKAKRNRALSGSLLAEKRTEIVDKLIKQAIVGQGFADLKNVAIIALGGYGRKELCPYSDIDLMFLYKSRNKTLAKEITEKLLYL